MHKIKLRRNNKGFSITELLIGLVILIIIMGPLGFMMGSSKKGLLSEEKYFQALFLAQKVAELYHAQLSRDPKYRLTPIVFDAPFDSFKSQINTEKVGDDHMLMETTITISWEEGGKAQHLELPFRHTRKFSMEIGHKLEFPWEDDL